MQILDYEIPTHLQDNAFIKSLHDQYCEKGSLSQNQIYALMGFLDIEIEFYNYDAECPDEMKLKFGNMFDILFTRLKENRFRFARKRNDCIIALNSILDCKPNYTKINKIFDPFNY